MSIYKVLTSLITVLSVGMLNAQVNSGDTPSLVVAVSVDQLRGDYVDLFFKSFGDKGIRKMMAEGTVYPDVDYNFTDLNLASALATVYTGVNPSVHSITSSRCYNPDFLQIEDVFYDKNFTSNYTLESLSPLALNSFTITDQLKKASADVSRVYSFAPYSTSAMILAGRLGNAGYWIDDNSGKWATTSYYTYYNPLIDQINGAADSYSNQIWNTQWKPLKKETSYPYVKTNAGFSHNLASNEKPIVASKRTPYVNEYTISSAIKLIEKMNWVKNLTPDFISIQLFAGDFPNSNSYETEDTYLRLDEELGKLIQAIETNVGIQNTLILLYSTGYYVTNEGSNDNVFFVDRSIALLNMYLTAKYGTGDNWVNKIYDNQIFLNKKLFLKKNIDLDVISKDVAEFMSTISGVYEAYSTDQLLESNLNDKRKNSLYKKKTGDVILDFNPGWAIKQSQSDTKSQDIYQKVSCPVIFYGFNIKPQKMKRIINATDITPALAAILRIRPPSSDSKNNLFELSNFELNKK